SPLVHELLGEAHDASEQPRQAEAEFKQAIAASPTAPGLHFLLGYLYWRWKRYPEAVGPLKEEVRIAPRFSPSYYYLGDIALKKDDPRQAREYFKQSLDLNSSYGDAYLGMGRAYTALGKRMEAIEMLRQAVRLMP